jgi:hypothetical protein
MGFLEQEISFDMGHLLLLIALVLFVFFVASRCKLTCNGNENLEIQRVHWKSCRCPACEPAVYNKAMTGELYGCDPNNPYVPYSEEECNYQYRKNALHGCGIA